MSTSRDSSRDTGRSSSSTTTGRSSSSSATTTNTTTTTTTTTTRTAANPPSMMTTETSRSAHVEPNMDLRRTQIGIFVKALTKHGLTKELRTDETYDMFNFIECIFDHGYIIL